MKILFVCSGNTCRSPMAEAMIRRETELRGLSGYEFESAGLHAAPGSRASVEAVEAMAARGIDISRRPARQITRKMAQEADAILTMTRSQANALIDDMPQFGAKIHTIGGYAGISGDVDDPWMGDAADYERTAEQIHGLISMILDRMR